MFGVLCLPLFAILSYRLIRLHGRPPLESFLLTFLAGGIAVVGVTEGLSAFRSLTRVSLLASWAALDGILLALYLLSAKKRAKTRPGAVLKLKDRFELSAAVGAGFILVVTGLTAVVAAPNTFDSMTYHLPRIMHWIQDQSVDHYPTHVLRQLHLGPWAEFAALQTMLLTGSDRLANLVQWSAFTGILAAVWLIATELGAGTRARWLAVILVATLPMGILQASSTQNDLVVALWLSCFVYAVLRYGAARSVRWLWAAGVALGLGCLTKMTAAIFGLPFVLYAVASCLLHEPKKYLKHLFILLLPLVLLNAGHWNRNIPVYGSPLGPPDEGLQYKYTNDSFGPETLASNLIRNVAMELDLVVPNVNKTTQSTVRTIQTRLGMDPADPRNSWDIFQMATLPFYEDTSGNLLHTVLILIAALAALWSAKKSRSPDKRAGYYAWMVCGGFILFCLALKWQPWYNRLHLPLLVIAMPAAALRLDRPRKELASLLCAGLVFAGAMPWLFMNHNRPLLGKRSILTHSRSSQYYYLFPGIEKTFTDLGRFLREGRFQRIGLALESNDWGYPIWLLTRTSGWEGPRIEHVGIYNASEILRYKNAFEPEVVIGTEWGLRDLKRNNPAFFETLQRIGPMQKLGFFYIFTTGSLSGVQPDAPR